MYWVFFVVFPICFVPKYLFDLFQTWLAMNLLLQACREVIESGRNYWKQLCLRCIIEISLPLELKKLCAEAEATCGFVYICEIPWHGLHQVFWSDKTNKNHIPWFWFFFLILSSIHRRGSEYASRLCVTFPKSYFTGTISF